jgi:peptide/nickel transport system substrate-binding protein
VTARGGRPRRWKRKLLVPACSALAICSACSATPSASSPTTTTTTINLVPAPGGSLSVGIDETPTSCNPNTLTGNTDADHLVLEPVLPSAFVVSASGEAQGNQDVVLQAELVNTAPQTIVYTLNPKAVWSDGVPISAEDFIYAWEQQRDVAAGGSALSASSLGYRDIESVRGSNDGRTVTVVFKTDFDDWPMLFNDLLPAHVLEHTGWSPACSGIDPAIDLSGGPYVLRSVTPSEIVMAKNPRWWGTAPFLGQITVKIASDPQQLAEWLAQGKVQVALANSYSPAFLEATSNDPTATSEVNTSSTLLQLEFATASPVTDSVLVRTALAAAVDRQEIVNQVVGFASSAITPAESHLYTQTAHSYPVPPAPATVPDNTANQLLADNTTTTTTSTTTTTTTTTLPVGPTTTTTTTIPASYPFTADITQTNASLGRAGYVMGANDHWIGLDGKPLALHLAVDGGDTWATLSAPFIVRDLQRADVEVSETVYPSDTATGMALASGAADLALLPTTTTPYPSQAIAWYSELLGAPGVGGSEDWTSYDNASVDALLVQAAAELNPVTAVPIYAQIDQMLWQDMVTLPLFAEPSAMAWRFTLDNLTPNPHGPGLLWNVADWENQIQAKANP